MGFAGLVLEATDVTGKRILHYGKTQKGLLRDHRKKRCGCFCGFCYEEACNGARYKHVKYNPAAGIGHEQ